METEFQLTNEVPESIQAGFEFPTALTEKYRPRKIEEFVGLEKVKRCMARLAAMPFSSAWLFIGPSGTGKTTMGLALAEAIPAELHHVPSQECNLENIERVRRTCQYVPMAGKKFHLILIDEADRMSDAAQVSLLSKLDSTNFPPNTIFIFTCNASDRLEPRFLSRVRVLEFSSYGISKEASALLAKVWEMETDNPTDRPNFARIVKESNNNVRESLMRLETEIMAS
jgi:replication-associated recombination protein RarA